MRFACIMLGAFTLKMNGIFALANGINIRDDLCYAKKRYG
jgi:hypothetical protein